MADHDELVAEMPVLETMGTQDRQKLAKKRRLQQLKRWSQREKELIAKEKQLNKRLATIMSEENNGLDLKQYTTYNSNQRTKKRIVDSAKTTTTTTTTTTNGDTKLSSSVSNHQTNGICKKEFNNNSTISGPYAQDLQPNGRVHFNVGVMLLEAAARNDYDEVNRLLALGVSPDSVNHDGLTALHQCCIDASEPIMQLLLDYGANVDARDTEKWTPLHAACTCGHLNLVKILVEHSADLLAVNGDGNMPFDICEDEATLDYIESQMVKQGITQEMIDLTRASTEMNMLADLEKFVQNQGNLNDADEHGVTKLHIAATNNYLSVVKFLLNHDVNVNVCDNDLWQPLHGVACWGNEQHTQIVELLVEAGANLDSRTLNDETVFDLCDNVELLERLNQLKDELDSKQKTGTGRLRRTQSRTNSRVHSVRRTSVRDKNQISRREAREEAMLRVDSGNPELPNELAVSKVEIPPNLDQAASNGQEKVLTNGSCQRFNDELQPQRNFTEQIHVTNLDCPDEIGEFATKTNDNDSKNRSQGDMSTQATDMLPLTETSAQTVPNTTERPRVTGTRILNQNSDIDDTNPRHQHQIYPMTSSSLQANASDRNHQSQNGITVTNQYQPTCDSSKTPSSNNLPNRQMSNATTVQVQFVPINFTLANLKKHRSDLRMRSCSIGGSTSMTSHIDAKISQYNIDPKTIESDHLTPVASILTMRESIRLDPEPNSANGHKNIEVRLNGANANRPQSPSSSFRKFHGVPSDILGGESNRRTRHKCCIVM